MYLSQFRNFLPKRGRGLKPLAYHLMVDLKQLENEPNVKYFIQEKNASIKAILDLLTELKPVKKAFPAIIS